MNHHIFQPQTGGDYSADKIIVTSNPALATLEGHAGDRAQVLADTTQWPVLCHDRPYSAAHAEWSLASYRRMRDDIDGLIAETVAYLNDIDVVKNADQVCIVGSSASAMFSLGLAANGLHADFLYAADPPGMRQSHPLVGYYRYIKGMASDAVQTRHEPPANKDNPRNGVYPPRLTSINKLGQEMLAHAGLIFTEQSIAWIERIAAEQPQMKLLLRAPRNTFTNTTAGQDEVLKRLSRLNTASNPNFIEVRFDEDLRHVHLDNYHEEALVVARHIDGAGC